MRGDYKYEMQERAEEIAEERYGKDFYALPDRLQTAVFREAMGDWSERAMARADQARKEEHERE